MKLWFLHQHLPAIVVMLMYSQEQLPQYTGIDGSELPDD